MKTIEKIDEDIRKAKYVAEQRYLNAKSYDFEVSLAIGEIRRIAKRIKDMRAEQQGAIKISNDADYEVARLREYKRKLEAKK